MNFINKFIISTLVLHLVNACVELNNSQMVTYRTTKQMLTKEGETIIPIVIDLIEYYNICGERLRNDALSGLFKTTTAKLNDNKNTAYLPKRRQKRIAPLIYIGAAGIAAAAWLAYDYWSTNGKIEELREELKYNTSYLIRLELSAQKETRSNFLAIRREMKTLSTKAAQTACNVEKNVTTLIFEHYFMAEFDDIIASLRTERFTSKIVPPSQLHQLIDANPILHDTIYRVSPYLLYYTGKISFNLEEVTGDILRGVLIIPLIKQQQEPVLMNIATRPFDDKVKVFKPVYVTEFSHLSVESCQNEIDAFICADSDLKEPQMNELTNPFLYEDGIIVINSGVTAMIKDRQRNSSMRMITGPAVCSYHDTDKVVIKNKIVYTHSSAFHIRQDMIDFTVNPYPIHLKLKDSIYEQLNNKIEAEETSSKVLHSTHISLTFVIILALLAAVIYLYKKLQDQKKLIVATANRHDSYDPPKQKEILIFNNSTTLNSARDGNKKDNELIELKPLEFSPTASWRTLQTGGHVVSRPLELSSHPLIP